MGSRARSEPGALALVGVRAGLRGRQDPASSSAVHRPGLKRPPCYPNCRKTSSISSCAVMRKFWRASPGRPSLRPMWPCRANSPASRRSPRPSSEFRGQAEEAAGLEAMLANPATDAELRGFAEEELRAVRARLLELEQDLKIALLPKRRGRRKKCDSRNSRRDRRRRGGAFRRRLVPDVSSLRRAERLARRDFVGERGNVGRLQGNHCRDR